MTIEIYDGLRFLNASCACGLRATVRTSVNTEFCTPYNLGPCFPNDAKILRLKIVLGPNQITN